MKHTSGSEPSAEVDDVRSSRRPLHEGPTPNLLCGAGEELVWVHAPTGPPGGTERRNAELFRFLTESNRTALVCLFEPVHPSLLDLYTSSGAEIAVLSDGRAISRHFGRDCSLFFQGTRPLLMTNVRPLRSRRGLVLVAHNGLDWNGGPKKWMAQAFAMTRSDAIITNSASAWIHLTRRFPWLRSRTHLVPSAVSDTWLAPATKDHRLNCDVMMVGNARPMKGQAIGLQAFISVLSEWPSASLTVYSDSADHLRATLEGHPSARTSVNFVTGRVLEPSDYDRHGILIHPSLSESLPRAVIEATCRGLLVVATDVGGTSSIVQPPSSVVPPGSHEPLAEALRRCLLLAASTERKVLQEPPPGALSTDQYVTAIDAILGRRGPGHPAPCSETHLPWD